MEIPGFTAEDTVYRTGTHYWLATLGIASPGGQNDTAQLIPAQQGGCDPSVSDCLTFFGLRLRTSTNCRLTWEPCGSTCTPEWGPCRPGGRQWGIDANCNGVTRTCDACTPGCDRCKDDPARGGTRLWRRCWDGQCNISFQQCARVPCTSNSQCPAGQSCGCCPVTTTFFTCWPWPFSFICSPAGSATTSTCCC